jgi:hypothetical protein
LSPARRAPRQATLNDLSECNELCKAVHGHDRGGELGQAIEQGAALVVERNGRISGYTSLIAATPTYFGPGFHVPNENSELLRWCYEKGFRMVKAMTLMTTGLYNIPDGKYLPSVLY